MRVVEESVRVHGRSITELSSLKTPSMGWKLKLEQKSSAELETAFRGSHVNPK